MENNKQEDLDLIWVLKGIQKLINRFFNLIFWLIDLSIKKFFHLALFMIAGFGIGLGISLMEKPYYSSQLIVAHSRLENDYCSEMINNLNSTIIQKTDNAALSDALNISTRCARAVKSFSFVNLRRLELKEKVDSLFLLKPFKIEVEVYNNESLDTLQKALLNYLESNEYAASRKKSDEEILYKIEQKLINENKQIDSLKMLVNKGIVPQTTGNGIILGEPINPITVYKQSMELYEKQMNIKHRIAFNNSFEAVVGFSKNPMPKNNFKSLYTFWGVLIGYLIGMIYLIRRTRQKSTS